MIDSLLFIVGERKRWRTFTSNRRFLLCLGLPPAPPTHAGSGFVSVELSRTAAWPRLAHYRQDTDATAQFVAALQEDTIRPTTLKGDPTCVRQTLNPY